MNNVKKRMLAAVTVALVAVAPMAAQGVDLNTYYADALGKKKAELKTAMHDIVSKATVLDYGGGNGKTWFGFYNTDRFGSNEVRDRYSNEHHYFSSSNPYSAVSGMNIEHAVANSWWGKTKNQAYKDLHHLMPCESSINSSKSNYGMGKVTAVTTDNGCTRVGKGPGASGYTIDVWEPADKWKGDFARVYFYMVTCYQDLNWEGAQAMKSLTNSDWPTLQPWAYELYLKWAQDDPVDDIERARNEAVYKIQHNRNPFIDVPELAEYIWGSRMDEAFTIDGTTPGPTPGPAPEDSTLLLLQNFKAAGIGDFAAVKGDGTQSSVWQYDAKYGMVANAYSLGKVADDYLISPAIDLTSMQGATLEFRHAAGYHGTADPASMFQVLVSSDYAQTPDEATWMPVEGLQWPTELVTATSKFTRFGPSGRLSLDDFAGEVINIAFRYTATSSKCWAWEVDAVQVFGKALPTGIDDNFMSPVEAEDAVFDMNGRYVGTDVPTKRGVYIVRKGGYTYKRFVK